MKGMNDVLTIAVTGEVAEHHKELCEFLSNLKECQSHEMNIRLLLLATSEHGRLIPLLSHFGKLGLAFNQVVMVQSSLLVNVTQLMQPDIILTTDSEQGEKYTLAGIHSVIIDKSEVQQGFSNELHFAFDGDSVLFCHNAQLVADNDGINAFDSHEEENCGTPMGKGPLFDFIRKIDCLQKCSANIKWSLVTARGGRALKRAMHTIEQWQLAPAQCFFMEGSDKTPILQAINADVFFDDHPKHCQRASGHCLVGHVQVLTESVNAAKL